MSSPNWAVAFGITDDDLADLKAKLPEQEDPLRWILANGYIPSNDYVAWARDAYELPSVKDDYFSVPADHVYWEAVKNEFSWTPGFFPLANWQGVMLIGCLQPPNFHFPLHAPHRFVIATAHALEHRYNELAPAAIVVPTHEPAEQQEIPHEELTPVIAAHVRQRPADEILADSLPAAPDVDMRDPEGFVIDLPESDDDHLFAVPEGIHVEDLGKPVPTTPDGLEHASQLIDIDSFDFSDPAAPMSQETVARPTPTPTPMTMTMRMAPPAQPVAPPVMTVVPPRAPIVPPGPPAAVLQQQQAANTPPPAPAMSRANVSSTEPAVPLATCSTIEALTSAVVAHVNMHFEHAMLMMYQNQTLKPTKWSELLLSVKGDNADAISLEQPSIFRIASRTSLPYHGYVTANPTNMAFFNAFNRGLLPKHVTVMPVVIGGTLSAMLVGLSSQEVDYKASLTAMEKISSDFATQLERLREKKVAA